MLEETYQGVIWHKPKYFGPPGDGGRGGEKAPKL